MKCTVFRVNVPYFDTSVPGKVDKMLAGLFIFKFIFGMGVGSGGWGMRKFDVGRVGGGGGAAAVLCHYP